MTLKKVKIIWKKIDPFLDKNLYVYHLFLQINWLKIKDLHILQILKSTKTDYDKTFEQFKEDYFYYGDENEEEIQEEFILSDFKTSAEVKVRGVYDNLRATILEPKYYKKWIIHSRICGTSWFVAWSLC